VEKTTVYLPEALKRAVSCKARAEKRSEADVIREAVVVATEAYAEDAPEPRLPLYRGPGNLASRVDELLAEGFGRD
jgi:hypothetical protein